MVNLICDNCVSAFNSDVIKSDYNWNYMDKYQVTMCPRCDTLLFWNYKFGTALAKIFKNLDIDEQHRAIRQI